MSATTVEKHTVHAPNLHLSQWIADQFPALYPGWAVDVGASDGISINSTYHLERTFRWTVLSVEANPDFLPHLTKHRAWVESCACAAEPAERADFRVHLDNPEAYSALKPRRHAQQHAEPTARWTTVPVKVETVDRLLSKWQFPRLDALCVDVEGNELDVLEGANLLKWKPKVVLAESWDDPDLPLESWLAARGYKRVGRNVHNSLFLKEGA